MEFHMLAGGTFAQVDKRCMVHCYMNAAALDAGCDPQSAMVVVVGLVCDDGWWKKE